MRLIAYLLLVFCLSITCISSAQSEAKLFLTVYQNDLAFVEHEKVFNLTSGSNDLVYDELSEQFLPESLFVDFPGMKILNLRFNTAKKLNLSQLLSESVGERLVVHTAAGEYAGYLQNVSRNHLLFSAQDDGSGMKKLIKSQAVEEVDFASQSTAFSNLQLLIKADTARGGSGVTARIGYLTRGLSWQASYFALLDEKELHMEFFAYAMLANNSGVGYQNAVLSLRTLNAATNRFSPGKLDRELRSERVAMPPQTDFTRHGEGEKFSFELQRPISIQHKDTVKIPLFDRLKKVPFERQYLYEPWRNPEGVTERLVFTNNRENHLGFMLPAGEIQILQRNAAGRQLFLGKSKVEAASAGEKMVVPLGRVTDIKALRVTTESKNISPRERQEIYKVIFNNWRDTAVTVTFTEYLPKAVAIADNSESYNMTDETTASFEIELAAGATKELDYTLRFKY